jgi:hypothetical protein
MANGGIVRLRSRVDSAGYAILDNKAGRRRQARANTKSDAVLEWYARNMEAAKQRLETEFKGVAGHKKLVREALNETDILSMGYAFVVPRGGRPTPYELSLGEVNQEGRVAFIDLANMPLTPEGVQSFTKRWGLLEDSPSFRVAHYYRTAENMETACVSGNRGEFDVMAKIIDKYRKGLGPLQTRFGWRGAQRQPYPFLEPSSQPYLFFEASSLHQFCWLDLMQTYSGGADVSCCPGCGTFLAMRNWGRPKKHCSDACRTRASRSRRRWLLPVGNNESDSRQATIRRNW